MYSKFLNHLLKGLYPVTVFLTNGVKLSGNVSFADNEVITLSRDGVTQLIMRHAVATIVPQDSFSVSDLG